MKKQLVVLSAAAIVAAAAVPALAFENEFHGMYKMIAYGSNFNNGYITPILSNNTGDGLFAEQRARLQYIAKANDNLKLVTHFELDTRFGGIATGYKGTTQNAAGTVGNDGGQLDADQLTLETKNIYLDYNCPLTGANVKVGLQPWADSYQSLFLLADMTGLQATKKFGALTANLGLFRYDDNTAAAATDPGSSANDMVVLDAKFAINKDMKVGGSYYFVNANTATTYDDLHMLGLNADLAFGPASIKPFAAYQFGEDGANNDISAYLLGVVAKVKVANTGAVNLSAIYLSGDDDGTGDADDFQTINQHTTYFNAANMWLLVRNGQAINSSTSVLTNDMTVGGLGLFGAFAGYEGAVDKLFYNANIGYMQAAEGSDKEIGTEFNAQVGYKLFDNMSVSAAAAYAVLNNSADVDDPYMANVQMSYNF